jgi:Tfp pilus assembly protein PilX
MKIIGVSKGNSPPDERGIALLTVMLVLLILSVLGIAALTVTGMENQIAGFVRVGEASATAAESCLGTGVNVIVQTLDLGTVPNALLDNAIPAGPVPVANQTKLRQEIMTQLQSDPDSPAAAPNLVLSVPGTPNFTVTGDIDFLYVKTKTGTGIESHSGNEGTGSGCASGGCEVYYRLDCRANNAATGASSRVVAVYGCMMNGPTCQKKFF